VITLLFHAERHWRGVADPACWATAHLMKTLALRCPVLALTFLVCGVSASHAQGNFTFHLTGEDSPGGGIDAHSGSGSITTDANTGQFQVDIAPPFDGDSFTPFISTPSGTLTFSLGTGTPATFPLWPSGNLVSGVQYAGSFQSSAAVYSDLLSGRGQFQLTATSGDYLWGDISAVPEPSLACLFVSGLVLCLLMTRRKSVSGTKPNQSRQPTPGGRLGVFLAPSARRGCALRSASANDFAAWHTTTTTAGVYTMI